jgi:anti-anti-sigma factor
MNLTLTSDTTSRSAILHIAGDVDYTTASALVEAAVKLLAEQPLLRNLHVDCAQMTICDSAGISGLITIHQRTSAAGVHLHLDRRPSYFERILDITGILDYLTAAPSSGRSGHAAPSVDMADESGAV